METSAPPAVRQVATRMAQAHTGNHQIDPATILIFIKVIMDVIAMMKNCQLSKKQVLDTFKNPGIIAFAMVKRSIKKNSGALRKEVSEMEEAFWDTLEVDDVKTLYV